MTAAKEKLSRAIDTSIPILILIQVAIVNLSIAVSSIMFGTWMTLWLIQILIDRKRGLSVFSLPDLKLINLFVLLYFLAEIISRLFAEVPEHAFDNIKRLLLFGIFYASVGKVSGTLMISRLLSILLGVMTAISLFELATYAIKFGELIQTAPLSEIRIDYLNHPLTLAEIKMMILLSVFPLLFSNTEFPIRRPYLIALCIPVIASMLLTQSRNVYVAFILCVLTYGLVFNRRFFAYTVILLVIGFAAMPSSMSSRLKSIFDTNHPSNRSRIVMWETGWKMFLEHPVAGVGDSKFDEVYRSYKIPEYDAEGSHLHNNFMMILATTGVLGFLTFSGLFFSLLYRQVGIMKALSSEFEKALVLGSIMVIVSFLIAGIFEWSFGDHEVMTVFFFLISVPFIINKNGKEEISNELHSS